MSNDAKPTELVLPETPVPATVPVGGDELGVMAAQARERALVEAKFVVAQGRPRNMMQVRDKLHLDCQRPRFAERARYRKPMGDSSVSGFSIRFAEAALQAFGNVHVQSTVTFEDDERRHCRVVVTDLESNTGFEADVVVRKTVERRRLREGQQSLGERTNASGKTVYLVRPTEEELLAKMNAGISKAIRNCGLRLLPSDLLEEAESWCAATNAAGATANPEAEKKALFDGFAKLGVRAKELQAYLDHDGSVVSPAELQELREVYAALRDGEATWREAMEQKAGEQRDAGEDARAEVIGDEGVKLLEQSARERLKALGLAADDDAIIDVVSTCLPDAIDVPATLPKAKLPAVLKRIGKWQPPTEEG